MTKLKVGDRVKIKTRPDWIWPIDRLAHQEGRIANFTDRPDLVKESDALAEFVAVRLDMGDTVLLREEWLEKLTLGFADCIKFANEAKDCYVATAEGNQPRVRALGMILADKTGFYFQSYTVKAIYKQLQENPKAELNFAYRNRWGKVERVMRVSGKTKLVEDAEVRARVFGERAEILKMMGVDSPANPKLAIFQVYTGEAYFWDMADNWKEAQIPRIKF